MLSDEDPLLVAAAAISLGAPGRDPVVPSLHALLASEHARVRQAAVRALGGVGTESAREVLAEAAQTHPDPGTRRSAAAALRVQEK